MGDSHSIFRDSVAIQLAYFCSTVEILAIPVEEGHLKDPSSKLSALLRRDYHQVSRNPAFAQKKRGPSLEGFLLIFLCLRPKRAPKKSAPNPGYQWYAHKSSFDKGRFSPY